MLNIHVDLNTTIYPPMDLNAIRPENLLTTETKINAFYFIFLNIPKQPWVSFVETTKSHKIVNRTAIY